MADIPKPPHCRACLHTEFTEFEDCWECDDCGIRAYPTNTDLLP